MYTYFNAYFSSSGNMMGDGGARLLAKALQINCRLRSIQYDRNNITLPGYCDLAYALERYLKSFCFSIFCFHFLLCVKYVVNSLCIVNLAITQLGTCLYH